MVEDALATFLLVAATVVTDPVLIPVDDRDRKVGQWPLHGPARRRRAPGVRRLAGSVCQRENVLEHSREREDAVEGAQPDHVGALGRERQAIESRTLEEWIDEGELRDEATEAVGRSRDASGQESRRRRVGPGPGKGRSQRQAGGTPEQERGRPAPSPSDEARKAIERAKGLLMAKEGLTEDEAFARLRKASQLSGKPLKVVAEALIALDA
jgi:hypothetical protein